MHAARLQWRAFHLALLSTATTTFNASSVWVHHRNYALFLLTTVSERRPRCSALRIRSLTPTRQVLLEYRPTPTLLVYLSAHNNDKQLGENMHEDSAAFNDVSNTAEKDA
ncbi:hypothetical protein MRX96_016756 [Rhipicephalus microplus]